MADESKAVQINTLISNLFKDYEEDFKTFRSSISDQLNRENLLNDKGKALALNTLESVKDTMNPVSHAVSDRHIRTAREGLADIVGNFGTQVFLWHDNYVNNPTESETELKNSLERFQQSVFSFNDKWQGKYEEIMKAHQKGQGLIIKLENVVFSIINWRP
jgi:hypothetical protein